MAAEDLGQLHRKGTHPAGSANDQYLLTCPGLAFATQSLESGQTSPWYDGRFDQRDLLRYPCELLLCNADVLGTATSAQTN